MKKIKINYFNFNYPIQEKKYAETSASFPRIVFLHFFPTFPHKVCRLFNFFTTTSQISLLQTFG